MFDIAILTTNKARHQEGISNSILECMAFAKPVIATDGGGTNEIVVHEKTGYLIKHGDISDLTDKILQLLTKDDLRKEMGQNAKQRIENEFSIERMVEGVIQMYKQLV